jgi:hypothetical protein
MRTDPPLSVSLYRKATPLVYCMTEIVPLLRSVWHGGTEHSSYSRTLFRRGGRVSFTRTRFCSTQRLLQALIIIS